MAEKNQGKTGWQILKERMAGRVETRYDNPLGAKVHDEFKIDILDYRDAFWRLEKIRDVNRKVDGDNFTFTDYDLVERSGDEANRIRLRFNPKEDLEDGAPTCDVLILKMVDKFAYDEDFHKGVLLGQMASSGDGGTDIWIRDPQFAGGFCIDEQSDGDVDKTFWRITDDGEYAAWEAKINEMTDKDRDGRVESEEVVKKEICYWDYWREMKDEIGDTVLEFAFVEMDGNGMFSLWRGMPINPKDIVVL